MRILNNLHDPRWGTLLDNTLSTYHVIYLRWEGMIDPNGKLAAGIALILGAFSYLGDVVPEKYRLYTLLLGLVLASIIAFRHTISKVGSMIMPYLLKKYCLNYSNEKYFRFLSINKSVNVYADGTGLVNTTYEALNEGKNYLRRFPHRIGTVMGTITPSLVTLQAENNFEVKSLDEHNLRWETVKDGEKEKLICVVYNDNINPGDRRKYSIRYQLGGIYKTRHDELPNGQREGTGYTPRHICDKFTLKLRFHPNYRYSNLRYCVVSPSKEEVADRCIDLTALPDTETGGTFIEITETNPWRNFSHRVEWVPENEDIQVVSFPTALLPHAPSSGR